MTALRSLPLAALALAAAFSVTGCGAEPTAEPAAASADAQGASDLFSSGDSSGADSSDSGVADVVDSSVLDVSPADSLPDSSAADAAASDTAGSDGASPDSAADAEEDADLEGDPDSDPGPQCGNFSCEPGETWALCYLDCPAPPAKCGDLQCTPGEDLITCAVDCDAETLGVVQCLLSTCAGQTAACLADADCVDTLGNAAQCLAYCTDAGCVQQCKVSLTALPLANAVAACGFSGCANAQAGAVCGDGSCDSGESTAKCPADCPASGGSGAAGGCADGNCSAGETAASCPFDCDPEGKAAWDCGAAKCPAEAKVCKADPACLKALVDSGECLKKCGTGSNCTNQCAGPVVGNSAALAFAMCGLQSCQP